MKKRLMSPLTRAVGVISAVAILVGGVTFAALQSQATLTDNTIASANADLKLWDGDSFESEAPGFTVTGLVPGEGSGPNLFYFQNAGETDLNISAHVPVAPEEPQGGYGFSGWENLDVTFKNLSDDCAEGPVETDMGALLAGDVELPCNPLSEGATGNNQPGAEGTEGNYSVEFDIHPEAVTGDHAGVGSFDIVFSGAAAASVED